MASLDRFHHAQEDPNDGHATALAELRAGRKTSHWIWYVFPQLAGLGTSPMARKYALSTPDEAAAYLRDPVLAARLLAVTEAVHAHLTHVPPAPIRALMGSAIDAQKLVSSMTVFATVARGLQASEPSARLERLALLANTILAAAKLQGLDACSYTTTQLARTSRPPSLQETLAKVDWSLEVQPSENAPDTLPRALLALARADEDTGQDAYMRLLSAVGNNHAGTYYPVVLAVVPLLGGILRDATCSHEARARTLDVLVDLGGFTAEPGLENVTTPDGVRPLSELLGAQLEELRGDVERLVDAPQASSDEVRLGRELLRDISDE